MELDYDTVLDIALGGPEIGPLNLITLHGLLRELFTKSGISKDQILIEEEDPVFSNAFKFIQSKVHKRPRTAGGGYDKLRSRVSVIVGDYAKSPIGLQKQVDEEKPPKILPADIEDRLKFIESELKIVKNFPSVDELRSWASEKTSPDTIVTDLWHFVSLNHRMNGAEEGIQKLTELVDKLIPELKKVSDDQSKCQGQIDDLYSQLKAISGRANHLNDRIDAASDKAVEKVAELKKEINDINEKLGDCASLNDLEDFVLSDVFVQEKDKARAIADQINEEMKTKAPLSLLSAMPDNSDLKRMNEEMMRLKDQMDQLPRKEDLETLDIYVKWPQLENAITSTPFNSRSSTSQQPEQGSHSPVNSRPSSSRQSTPTVVTSEAYQTSPRPPSSKQSEKDRPDSSSSNRSYRSHRNSRPSSSSNQKQQEYQPSDDVIKRLNELGMLNERHNALMDALDRTREQLALKADKSDLDGLLNNAILDDLLSQIRNLKENLSGLQHWRDVLEEERLPEFRNLMKMMEEQISNILKLIEDQERDGKAKQRSIDSLYTYIERLEENKLERDDPAFLELAKNLLLKKKDSVDGTLPPIADDSSPTDIADELNSFKKSLQELNEALSTNDKKHDKEMAILQNDLEDKLDRSELQPLREYLENRYNVLSQQQQEGVDDHHQCNNAKHRPTPPQSGKQRPNMKTSTPNGFNVSHPINQHNIPQETMSSVDGLGCSHPHYGNGFVPHSGQGAVVRTQMKFNCLSCDRPLTMQTNSAFQTVRGRPLNAYELDQLRVLQKILKGDKTHSELTRPVGGKHTKSLKNKKARTGSSKSHQPVLEYGYDVDDFVDGEVDIEGIDGRLYKGLISQKDLKRHLRRKSANAELRTVTPGSKTPHRPVSGKSVDLASSYNTSGLGTTHGSFDIQINH
eukprot:TCONS_00003888-protein